GVAKPLGDIEIIALAAQILNELGLSGKVKLELNSLGDTASRSVYRDRLVTYLENHRDSLSKESLERLAKNPLRILDSKDEGDQAIVAGAPLLQDSLNDDSREFFNQLKDGLNKLGIAFEHNLKLVRGLDYYCHTAFEFTTEHLGAQSAVLAGGRYDGLIGQMGGPATPGTGWAAGVERLALLLEEKKESKRSIAVIPVDGEAESEALVIAERLRTKGYTVDLAYSGNLKKRMKRANNVNACAAILLGDDELTRNVGTVRDMDSGDQKEVSLESLEDHLADYR
ncbi:MAG: histidine--tRNA ligase, partial [Rhodospirillales bacterium]|nr:histidine--tRNA ligase [Rhodospirillales bacterium]